MTASTRFLGMAVLAWAGVRAVSLAGVAPGTGAAASSVPTHPVETPEPTLFAPLDPVISAPSPIRMRPGQGRPIPNMPIRPKIPIRNMPIPNMGPRRGPIRSRPMSSRSICRQSIIRRRRANRGRGPIARRGGPMSPTH